MKCYPQGGFARLATLAAALLLGAWVTSAVSSDRDRREVAKMTGNTKTVCVGRFLIDLPANAEVSLGRASIGGFDIGAVLENQVQFQRRVKAREAEIRHTPLNELGTENLEARSELTGPGLHGEAFVFGRWGTSWTEKDRRVQVEAVAIESHVHHGARDVSFNLTAKNYDPVRFGKLPILVSHLAARGAQEIPTGPGFCIDRGLVTAPLSAEQNESVTMFVGLPGHPDLAIVFSTRAGTKPERGLRARSASALARQPYYVRAAFNKLAEGERTINGLAGEEIVMKVTEANLTTNFSFDWEAAGREDDVNAPLLTLEMQTGINPRAGGKPVDSGLSEAALTDLWHRISSSIRLRPSGAPFGRGSRDLRVASARAPD
jgi:hypothetical protein